MDADLTDKRGRQKQRKKGKKLDSPLRRSTDKRRRGQEGAKGAEEGLDARGQKQED